MASSVIQYFILINFICICTANEKGCRMSQLDAKMKPLSSLASDAKWPDNEQAMARWCSSMAKDLTQMREHVKKCIKAEAKTIMSVALHSVERISLKTYCKIKVERTKFLAAAKCVNSGTKSATKCWSVMISQITAVSNTTISKDKIPMLCCSLFRWKDCFLKVFEEMGHPKCSPADIDVIDQYAYKGTIETLNIFCNDFDDSDKCKKFESFLSKNSNNRIKYSTVFPATIDVFENL